VRKVTLLTKPGCHLCDDARTAVREVLDGLGMAEALEERSILDDPALFDRHWDEIPVVLIDGAVHTIYRVDRGRLAAALRS